MTDIDDLDSARWFASLARDLAEQPDHDSTLRRIAELAQSATGCTAVGIAHLKAHGLAFDHATDPDLVSRVFDIAQSTHQGAVWTALHTRDTILIDDLSIDTRWPTYRDRVLAETPVRSVLAYCLILDDLVLGAMALYSDKPGFFTESICAFASIYADHAAIALARTDDQGQIEHLEQAVESNRVIGAAMGIMMAALEVKMDTAFDLLRLTSQNSNRKLHDICEEVVRMGDMSPIHAIANQTARRRAGRAPHLHHAAGHTK